MVDRRKVATWTAPGWVQLAQARGPLDSGTQSGTSSHRPSSCAWSARERRGTTALSPCKGEVDVVDGVEFGRLR